MGYAGLKDKHAMTIQYISVMAVHEEKLKAFTHDKIKILESVRHNNKIRGWEQLGGWEEAYRG